MKSVIFDLDDTLFCEKDFAVSGFRAVADYVAKKHSISPSPLVDFLIREFEEGVRHNNLNRLIKKFSLLDDVKTLVTIYREHMPTIKLYPDARKALDALHRKYNLGLITDGHPITQQNKINALGIGHYFHKIIINDTSKGMTKLDSHSLTEMLQTLGNPAVFVGDNPLKDFKVPHQFGVDTIRVVRGTGEYDHIRVADDARKTIYYLADLEHYFGYINVLVLPAGTGMAITAIKSLKKDPKIRIFSADCDELAPGLYLSSKHFIVPRFDHASFYPALKNIIAQEHIDVIIPAHDGLLISISKVHDLGTKILISPAETVEIARDKWATYILLKDVIPCPLSFITKEFDIPYDEEITLDKKRDFDYYDKMLYKAFSEVNKILKTNRYLIVTFHNSQPRIFNSIMKSCVNAGFVLEYNGWNIPNDFS